LARPDQYFSPKIRDGLTELLQRNLQQFVSGQLLLGLFMAITLTLAFWSLRVLFSAICYLYRFDGGDSLCGSDVRNHDSNDCGSVYRLALQVLAVAIALQQVKTIWWFSNHGQPNRFVASDYLYIPDTRSPIGDCWE